MPESMRIVCLTDRHWDPAAREFAGTWSAGTLLDFSVQSDADDDTRFAPVGVVLLEDGTMSSVPLEFIKKETTI